MCVRVIKKKVINPSSNDSPLFNYWQRLNGIELRRNEESVENGNKRSLEGGNKRRGIRKNGGERKGEAKECETSSDILCKSADQFFYAADASF